MDCSLGGLEDSRDFSSRTKRATANVQGWRADLVEERAAFCVTQKGEAERPRANGVSHDRQPGTGGAEVKISTTGTDQISLGLLNNIASIYAQNNLNQTQASLQNTLEQLSSGSRINSGADDAAGLAVANGLQANISALNQSSQNVSQGIGLLQTADDCDAEGHAHERTDVCEPDSANDSSG